MLKLLSRQRFIVYNVKQPFLHATAIPAVCCATNNYRPNNVITSTKLQSCRWNSSHAGSSFIANIWQSMSTSTPVAYMQDTLISIHDASGLPWWATIIVSTIVFRTLITLPLTIYQQKIMARMELLTLEMPAIIEELKREAAMAKQKFNWTDKETKRVFLLSLRKQWDKLIVRDNCHPAKMFIVLWGQIPLWICQSIALRNLVNQLPDPLALKSQIAYIELCVGGFGWIPNLTEIDQSYILPITLTILNLSIIEVQNALRSHLPKKRIQIYATNAFRLLSLAMLPIASTVPSALCVYWTASSSYGLAQNLLLATPAVRRFVGIPATDKDIKEPFTHLSNTFKMRTETVKKIIFKDKQNKL